MPGQQRRSNVPTPEYYHAKFRYDKERDCYICPQQHQLQRRYTFWAQKQLKTVYGSPACRECPVKPHCSVNKNGRLIYRTQHDDLIQRLRARLSAEPDKLKERQCLSEHPFGTIKQWMNQGAFLMHGLEKVRGEFSLTALAYNLRRALNILGMERLMAAVAA